MRLYCGYRNWRIARLFFLFVFLRFIEWIFSFLEIWRVCITAFKSSRATFLLGYSGLGNESTAIAYSSRQTFFTRDFLHTSEVEKLLSSVSDNGNCVALLPCALCIASRPRPAYHHPSSECSRDQLPTNRFFPQKNTLSVLYGFQRTHALS